MFRNIKSISILISVFVLLIGCNSPFSKDEELTGNILINIDSDISRTICPEYDIESYCFNFSNGPVFKDSFTTTSNTIDLELPIGTWDISVEAFNSSSEVVAQGSLSNLAIDVNTANNSTIYLDPITTGTGFIDITILYPKSIGLDMNEVYIDDIAIHTDYYSDYTDAVDPHYYSFSYNQELNTGDYKFTMLFSNDSSVRAVYQEIFKIYRNLTSSEVITLEESDFNTSPTAPSDLTVSSDIGSLNLSWTDNANTEVYFEIERSIASTFDIIDSIITVNAGITTYTDRSVTAGTKYYYRVRATNSFGESTYSNIADLQEMASDITIVETINNPIEITFDYTGNQIIHGEDISITATTNEIVDSYCWYLDSTLLSETTNTLTIGSELGYGNIAIILLVNKGDISSTKKVNLEIRQPEIGDSYGGGIVFYLDENGGGLIAAPTDQSDGVSWTNNVGSLTNVIDTDIGTGVSNTTTIVSILGEGTYAAKLCYDLVLDGYDDWFLPSIDELNQMYVNRAVIGGFSNGYYWSSSEYDNYYAWRLSFSNGGSYEGDKNGNLNVRPVRAF